MENGMFKLIIFSKFLKIGNSRAVNKDFYKNKNISINS